MTQLSSDVLLVGSVPFSDVEEVLRTCAEKVGDRAVGLPDGELGLRSTWIGALPHMSYEKCPDLEPIHVVAPEDVISPDGHDEHMLDTFSTFKLKPGVTETRFDLHFGHEGVKSYETFTRLREAGVIAPGTRFQVAIPFPSDAIDIFFPEPADRGVVHAAYVGGVQDTLALLLDNIPAADLVIQWDCCTELLHCIGGLDEFAADPPPQTVAERFAMLTSPEYIAPMSSGLPDDVLVGYHFCFGTWGGWPISRVLDIGMCVRLANAYVANTPRRVDYVHLPAMPDPPEGFFAPLADLDIGDTKVFLGIELADGYEAMMDRVEQARQHLPRFGLSHYCGYGRESGPRVKELLDDISRGAQQLTP